MSDILGWLLVAGLAVAFNVTPLFAPPTVGLLAYFQVEYGHPPLLLAIVGAAGAATGRAGLAVLGRLLGERIIPERRSEQLGNVVAMLRTRRSANVSYLALFAVGPVPKGTLFAAAGLARLPILPAAVAFGLTRFVVYAAGLLIADVAVTSFSGVMSMSVAGPLVIALQVGSLVAVVLALRCDWSRWPARWLSFRTWLRRRLPARGIPAGTPD